MGLAFDSPKGILRVVGKSVELRHIRVDDFIAEMFEKEADGLPKSEDKRAQVLRDTAQIFRASSNPKMIWVRTTQK